MLAPWKKNHDQLRQHIKKQRHYFVNKGPSNQGYGFSSSHVWVWDLDYKESWAPKNWCFWTVVLEKTLESPLDGKEIKPVHPKRKQSWIFIGRTDPEAETPILRPPDVKNWLIWKILMLGKIEGGRSWWWQISLSMYFSAISLSQFSCSVVSNSLRPVDCSTPGFSVFHHLLELVQTHVHWVGDAIQPSHPLSSPSLPAFNLSQHQGLFQWVDSAHQVAKILELQLQHLSFQWILRIDIL